MCGHGHRGKRQRDGEKDEDGKGLTCGWLVAVVSVPEVLRILHHRNTSHPYDDRIRTRIQSAGGDNPVVDVMKRAGRVFFTTNYSYRTWKEDIIMMSHFTI